MTESAAVKIRKAISRTVIDIKSRICSYPDIFPFFQKGTDEIITQRIFIIQTSFVWDICQGADSRIYVSSMQEGLFCFEEKGTFLQNYPVLLDSNIGSQRINCLYSIKNEIWFDHK